jgi:hypothetical protein
MDTQCQTFVAFHPPKVDDNQSMESPSHAKSIFAIFPKDCITGTKDFTMRFHVASLPLAIVQKRRHFNHGIAMTHDYQSVIDIL